MGDLFKLMQQAQQFQSKMQDLQQTLERAVITGTAGGGLVAVEADGSGKVKRVRIDPSVVKPAEIAALESLVATATVDAQRKAQEFMQREMQALTGGMDLPFPMKLTS